MTAEQVLTEACDAVRRDLGRPDWEDAVEAALAHRRWWLEQWPDGAPHVLGLLAQDVQEAVHERDPLWPACSEGSCPAVTGHPLLVEPDLGLDPFWTCHRTGLPVAPVGRLQGPPADHPPGGHPSGGRS
jgi:hypothetical protein